MIHSTKERADKTKALKKLVKKWLNTDETQQKADLVLAKNPGIKVGGGARARRRSK